MTEALVIVAHPDDETIWMGGTILKNKDWKWIILCLSRASDPDRMPKFKKVCEFLNAEGIISDLDDEHLQPLEIEKVINKIKSNLPKNEFDCIFTHGENGEYGHLRHQETHKAVKKMIEDDELKCNKVYYFSYKDSNQSVQDNPNLMIQKPNEDSDLLSNVSEQHSDKIKIIKNLYGFQDNSFETLCCKDHEAFNMGQ